MENDPLWCPEVTTAEATPGQAPGVGATFRIVARPIPINQVGGYEITRFEPPSAMDWKVWQDRNTGTSAYRLEPVDGGTRLFCTIFVSVAGFMVVFEPLIGFLTSVQRGPRMLRNLKRILEDRGAAPAL